MSEESGEDLPELPPAERWHEIWTHRALLLRIARRRGAGDAEDVVEEALLRAAEHPEIPPDRLRSWLVVVTERLCVNGYRRRSKETSSWARATERVSSPQPGQHVEDDVCERAVAAWAASVAADALPARQIQALRLTADGCDVRQVAIELGVSYRAAESLLARARRTLRAALTTGLAVLGWTWRAPVVGSPVQVGLAAATAAAVAVAPLVLPAHQQPLTPSRPPAVAAPALPLEPTTGRSLLSPQVSARLPAPSQVAPGASPLVAPPPDVSGEPVPAVTHAQDPSRPNAVGARSGTRSGAPVDDPRPAARLSPRAAAGPHGREARPADGGSQRPGSPGPDRGQEADRDPGAERGQSTDRGDHMSPARPLAP